MKIIALFTFMICLISCSSEKKKTNEEGSQDSSAIITETVPVETNEPVANQEEYEEEVAKPLG